jgi:hypothetical protein
MAESLIPFMPESTSFEPTIFYFCTNYGSYIARYDQTYSTSKIRNIIYDVAVPSNISHCLCMQCEYYYAASGFIHYPHYGGTYPKDITSGSFNMTFDCNFSGLGPTSIQLYIYRTGDSVISFDIMVPIDGNYNFEFSRLFVGCMMIYW